MDYRGCFTKEEKMGRMRCCRGRVQTLQVGLVEAWASSSSFMGLVESWKGVELGLQPLSRIGGFHEEGKNWVACWQRTKERERE